MINRANDRHGELENETAAIAWLFNNLEKHMKKLTRDIVEQGEIFDIPLVHPERDRFIVFDGNRRVTCLKLISNPKRAPTIELQKFYDAQKIKWNGALLESIDCQVEMDRDRIDEILFRRHTGSQSGVGQSTWDDRIKATFVSRTGKGAGFNIAEEIENILTAASLAPNCRKIPRSTMNRLLSSEQFRNRLGISVVKGRMFFTHDKDISTQALARVANDLATQKIVLGDIWDIDGKQKYLDKLEAEGALPSSKDIIIAASPTATQKTLPRSRPTPLPKPQQRETLIPNKDYGLTWPGRLQRHHQIWEELQFHLELKKQPNAIAVLFRVLLEISVENYIKQQNLSIFEKDKLANKIQKVGKDLSAKDKIDHKVMTLLGKFQHSENLISADTFNRYVHSPNFSPSSNHLCTLWDSLSEFIVLCLKA